MKPGFNFIVDAFWGSSGKGKLGAWLSDQYKPVRCSSSNYPNAGHTIRIGAHVFVLKVLPSAAATWAIHGKGPEVYITPGSGFWPEQLIQEIALLRVPEVRVHERAVLMKQQHVDKEKNTSSLAHIASTMQGTSAAMIDKISRIPWAIMSGNDSTWPHGVSMIKAADWLETVHDSAGLTWLHEVSQGSALSIDHGTHYPHCTSRNATVAQAMSDLGISPKTPIGDIYLNVRSFPIRVGNLGSHNSGEFMPDSREMSLSEILRDADAPIDAREEYAAIETTTVTKRPRRMSTISWKWLAQAAKLNGATKLVLNFAQYIDWRDYKCQSLQKLSKKTLAFMVKMEEVTNVPVTLVGTGPDHFDWVVLP